MTKSQKITSTAKINPTTKIIYPDEEQLQIDSSLENSSDYTETIQSKKSNDASTKHVPNNFREKIIRFVKLDDLIREETILFKEKLETLKSQKEELSAYILRHLEDVGENEIDLEKQGKISKYTSIRKSGLNKDIIQQSIYEKLKNEKLIKTDDEGKILAQATYEIMESKRKVNEKVTLKRVIKREKKQKNKQN